MKVYMVHCETGEYSDWLYRVLGIFSCKERAKEYLRSIKVLVDGKKRIIVGHRLSNLSLYYDSDDMAAFDFARPVDQGDGRWTLMSDGKPVYCMYGYDFFITEHELDDAPVVNNETMMHLVG